MKYAISRRILGLLGASSLVFAASAAHAAGTARISNLSDVPFGTISNFTTDLSSAQNVCVYSSTGKYQVTATGNGASSAFTIASGSNTLAYTVQWAATSGRTTGTALTKGVALTNLTSAATSSTCTNGLSASLIIGISTTAVGAARAGAYTGTLTLVIAPN